MSRGQRTWEDVEKRFPRLQQFFGCYLHEDRPGTPLAAVDEAIADYPLELRQQVRRELAELLGSTDEDTSLRRLLNDGLGVNVYFRKPREARTFAEEVERKLLGSIKAGYEHREDRKP